MPAPVSLSSNRTGTPDGTNGIQIPSVSSQEDSNLKILGGLSLSDRVAAGVSPDRSALSAADTATDMSTSGFGGSLLDVNNRGAILVWATFATANSTASVRVIYYDSSSNPLFVSELISLSGLTGFRVSAAGEYMSIPELVESYGASKYELYLVGKGSGNVSLYSHPI